MEEKKTKHTVIILVIMGMTAALITVAGILFKQSPLRMLPLYVSLIISLMQSQVSRYAPLVGGINALLYAVVYAHYHLYASVVYTVLVSCPLQIITFMRWSRHPWHGSTILKKLTIKQSIVVSAGSVAVWGTVVVIMNRIGAAYSLFDTATMILGILATVLMMMSYIEYTVLMLAMQVCSIGLYIVMIRTNPEQLTYLIYSLYALICVTMAFARTREIYKIQRSSN